MQDLLAGWVAGYGVSIVFTFSATMLLIGARLRSPWVRRLLPATVNPIALGMVLSFGAMLGWTLAGLILGAIYRATSRDAAAGLGSPAAPFTIATVAAVTLVTLPALFLRGIRVHAVVMGLAAAGAFGWLLPLLAER